MYQQNLFAALFYPDHGGEGVDGGIKTTIYMA